MLFLLLLPFGGALAARLRHLDWRAWAVWGGAVIMGLAAIWIASGSFSDALIGVPAASAIGFLGPELWESCRGFMRHPRVFGGIAAFGALAFLIYNQQLLGALMMIGIVCFAFRVMFRPLRGRSRSR